MKKNREYIANLFSRDGLRTPESLSEDAIRQMLSKSGEGAEEQARIQDKAGSPVSSGWIPDNPEPYDISNRRQQYVENDRLQEHPGQVKKSRLEKRVHRKVFAAAACLMIAVLAVPQILNQTGGQPDPVTGEQLRSFEDYKEIRKLVKKMDRNYGYRFEMSTEDDTLAMAEEAPAADGMTNDTEASAAASGKTAVGGGDGHSSTYLQVEDVDEGDIIKTDGKYIYYVNENKEVLIYSADQGNTEKIAEIGSGEVDNYIHDIYLKGDTLVTVGVIYEDSEKSSSVITYDISDRSSPELLHSYRQSGEIVSSRMAGDYVYLVTSESVNGSERFVPKATRDGDYKKMEVSDICAVPEPEDPSYVILGAVDIRSGKEDHCRSKAILGASDDIYCNNKNLYAAATEYSEKQDEASTRIIRAALDGEKIHFDATAAVPGRMDDQFSMDEKDGYLRIATTSTRDGVDTNNLYVLDSSLQEAGKVTGFARNESIRAVRYLGDKAYVITFEAVDPLFIIDLSNPSAPRIEGQVEIEGFSSLLVPVGEGRMLGIGYLTSDNGYGGVYTDGLKLALFDISDPSHPAVLDSEEFRGLSSPAQEDHHALVVNSEKGYCAIPYNNSYSSRDWAPTDDVIIEDAEEGAASDVDDPADIEQPQTDAEHFNNGVLLFGAGDEITLIDQHKLTDEQLQRNVYIGDWIYALDSEGQIYSFQYQ